MPKPAKFAKGRKLSKEEYKQRLEKYYKEQGKAFHQDKAYNKFKNRCINEVKILIN